MTAYNYEEVYKQADATAAEIVSRVKACEIAGRIDKPTVIVSRDLWELLRGAPSVDVTYYIDGSVTLCGYEVKVCEGRNVLFVGYDIL